MLNRAKAIVKIGLSMNAPVIFKYSRINVVPKKSMFGTMIPKFNFAGM
jgi:hypothetical protein